MVTSDLFMRAYSTYFTDSIRTMLSFQYDQQDIKLLFAFLRSIGTNRFAYATVKDKLDQFADKDKLCKAFGNCNDILRILFNANMICYIETGARYRWKYREVTLANYDFDMPEDVFTDKTITFRVHQALEKELSLY